VEGVKVKASFTVDYEVPDDAVESAYPGDVPVIFQETENLEEGDYLVSLLSDEGTNVVLNSIEVTP
jgi:hypothetical protein